MKVAEEALDVVLITEDQFEVVVTFVGFIASHVEVGCPATIDSTKAFVDSVVMNGRCHLQPAAVIKGRHPQPAWPELKKPIFVDFLYILLEDLVRLRPLLFREPGLSSTAFWTRGVHMAEHLSH